MKAEDDFKTTYARLKARRDALKGNRKPQREGMPFFLKKSKKRKGKNNAQ